MIDECVDLGILTYKKVRKYPLRSANLFMVLKAHAIETHQPYTVDATKKTDEKLYLTDAGLTWLYHVFTQRDLTFLRSVFQFVFSKATEYDLKHIDKYEGMKNFKGLSGERPKAGTKQKALLIRTRKKVKQEFHFDNIREARQEILHLTRFYPADEFKLYRIRTTKRGTFKEEIPLIIGATNRGAHLRS